MKKFISMLTYLLMGMFMVVGFSACTDDDDEPAVQQPTSDSQKISIIGTWLDSGGVVKYTFKTDGTGERRGTYGSDNFNYTFTPSNEGASKLKLWYVGSDEITNYDITISGKTMMMASYYSTYVLTKVN